MTDAEKLEDKDREDFLEIWFRCSEFDGRGNLQTGKWSKLNDDWKFPFSKERAAYLIGKFLLGLDDSENKRVAE